MEADEGKQKARWRFGVTSKNTRHQSHRRRRSSAAHQEETNEESSPVTWDPSRRLGNAFRRPMGRKSFTPDIDHHHEPGDDMPKQPTSLGTPASEEEATNGDKKAAKSIRRSMTMPTRFEKDGKNSKTNDSKNAKASTFVLKQDGSKEILTPGTTPYCPAYDMRAKSKSMVTSATSSSLSQWRKRVSLRKRGNRKALIAMSSSMPPDIEEETSLDTEEMVGFECIDTVKTENRSTAKSRDHIEPSKLASSRLETVRQSEQLQTSSSRLIPMEEVRQDCSDEPDKSNEQGSREATHHSETRTVAPSIEVSMSQYGARSIAARNSSRGTHHFSVTTKGTSHRRRNRFFPSFMQLGRLESSYDITVYEDEVYEDDMSNFWTEASSRGFVEKSSSEESSSSESSSCSSSFGSSYESSSSEDDDLESCSIASNSTISTRASEINKRWDASVLFSESLLDADRRRFD